MSGINIQPGHIARHTPRSAGAQGREAAVVDVAQDLLLQYLHRKGILDLVAVLMSTQNPATFRAKNQPPYIITSELPQ